MVPCIPESCSSCCCYSSYRLYKVPTLPISQHSERLQPDTSDCNSRQSSPQVSRSGLVRAVLATDQVRIQVYRRTPEPVPTLYSISLCNATSADIAPSGVIPGGTMLSPELGTGKKKSHLPEAVLSHPTRTRYQGDDQITFVVRNLSQKAE